MPSASSDQRRRDKVAALRHAEQRRRRSRILVTAVVVVVLLLLVALVAVRLATGSKKSSARTTAAADHVVSQVASVPASTYDAVGIGTTSAPLHPISPPQPIRAEGKPLVLYVGAEYCPYCAAERWAVVAALSRFGTFTGLGQTHSSSTDVYPSTATLSFHGASYSSPYLAFRGYETESNQRQGNGYAPLDTLPAEDQAIFQKIDGPPYVPASSAGGIPFIDIAGHVFATGATYDPGVLHGLTHRQIAASLKDPSSKVARAIDGSANMITAAVCDVTGGKPAAVCTSAGVKAASAKVPAS